MSVPSVIELSPPVERGAVLRCLDYPPGREPPARTEALLAEILPEARGLLTARGRWLALDPARCGEVGLVPVAASGLVIGLVTLGPALEQRVAALQGEGALTRALILDACGSAAAEEAADLLSGRALAALDHLDQATSGAPGTPGCRLSPGFGGWGLAHQPALLAMLGAQALGVDLSPGLMMIPRKSISFALWIGARERPAAGLAGCRACGLRRCRHRLASA